MTQSLARREWVCCLFTAHLACLGMCRVRDVWTSALFAWRWGIPCYPRYHATAADHTTVSVANWRRCPCVCHACRATFDPDTIRSRLRELAFLNSRATIFFRVVDGKAGKSSSSSSNGSSSSGGSGKAAAVGKAAAGGKAAAAAGGKTAAAAALAAEAAATLSPAAAEVAAEGWEVLHFAGGLAEYVRYLNRDKTPIHDPICFSKQASMLAMRMNGC